MTKTLFMVSCDNADRLEIFKAIDGVKGADVVHLELMSLRQARREFEKAYIRAQLARMAGNISQTARFIDMERSALHRKIKQIAVRDDNRKHTNNQ